MTSAHHIVFQPQEILAQGERGPDMASAQWCSLPGLVHTLCRNSANRRRQRETRPWVLSMFSSQRKLECSVRFMNVSLDVGAEKKTAQTTARHSRSVVE